uniref:Semaphorin-3C n=1 Tax=Callorhinchus milii TaxID=7868 RepID=A0A4W3JX11_CALMI
SLFLPFCLYDQFYTSLWVGLSIFVFFVTELQDTHTSQFYSLSQYPLDYRILLMDEDQDRIYVGSKDHILSLNVNNISQNPLAVHWAASSSKVDECKMAGKDPNNGCGNFVRVIQAYNRTHLYVCGSGAFSPVCTYINRGRRSEDQTFVIDSRSESGKGRCSFNPQVNTVSLMINEELFSGMYIDFMGTDAAIFRSLTKRNGIRTDQHNSKWLSEPVFVDAHFIPDGTDPNDAKLYFFLREKVMDGNGNTKQIHSRIARVCPNDMGGQRSLVNKWTTFLKARLVCSVVDDDGTETLFDELHLFGNAISNARIITIVISCSLSSVFQGSAVCVYNMIDIHTVFNGPFAHKEGPSHQYVPFQGRIPYPRPGTCPGGAFTPNMLTTKDFPDEVVTFVRNHPMMYNPIYPINKQPLIVRINAEYKYTKIVVDQVKAADGRYHVLFLGTDKGTVQKIVILPKNTFQVKGCDILSFLLPSINHSCADCCLARDPYCAWDGKSCSRFYLTGKRRSRRQDVRHGNPLTQCRGFNLKAYRNAKESVQYGVKNSSAFLECMPKSPQASVRWLIQKPNDRRKEIKQDERIVVTEHGLLIRSTQSSDQGFYHCIATENTFKSTVMKINLKVVDVNLVPSVVNKQTPWPWGSSNGLSGLQVLPKDLVGLFSYSEMQAINKYCKESRLRQMQNEEVPSIRVDHSKLKVLIDRRKSRNRRNQLSGT